MTDLPENSDITQIEQAIAAAGERVLVERLHRVLDEGGIAAHRAFTKTLLPYMQALITVLPRLAYEGTQPAAIETVRSLTTNLRDRGAPIDEVINEGITLHERLLAELLPLVPDNDRAIVRALGGLSQTLLDLTRDIVRGAETGASALPVYMAHSDSQTGLAHQQYFEERFGEELQRAQRLKRELGLVLLDMEQPRPARARANHVANDNVVRAMSTLLRAQIRGIDLSTRLEGTRFALLLPETDRGGAAALLSRLSRVASEPSFSDTLPRFKAGVAVYPRDGKTVHELMGMADRALSQVGQDDLGE